MSDEERMPVDPDHEVHEIARSRIIILQEYLVSMRRTPVVFLITGLLMQD
jgi:hypothetical protein